MSSFFPYNLIKKKKNQYITGSSELGFRLIVGYNQNYSLHCCKMILLLIWLRYVYKKNKKMTAPS